MLRRIWPFFFVLLFGFERTPIYQTSIVINEPPAEIAGSEDLMGRLEFERLQTADPKTGKIPRGIRKAELAFAKASQSSARSVSMNVNLESAGPFNVGGRTRAVAFDIRDENTILAGGVSGGVWKSTDGGQTWVRKSDPTNRNSVTCLVQDTRPGREDTWYHGTGEIVGNSARGGNAPFRGDGIYKSIDNGETWNAIPSTQDANPTVFNSQFQYIWDIVLNPDNLVQDELYVAAFGAILKSLDGGDTWEVEVGQELFNLNDTVDLNDVSASFFTSVSRDFNGYYYGTLSTVTGGDEDSPDAGVFLSTDGSSWDTLKVFERFVIGEPQYRRIVAGHSQSNPNISYFLVDTNPVLIFWFNIIGFDPDPIFGVSIRETPNFGGTLGNFNTQGSYNMMIKVHPNNSDIVFAGGTNLYRTTDGFSNAENFTWVGGYNPEGGASTYANHHPDQHNLLFYPSNPDQLLSASDGGLRVSLDGTADTVVWESINNGFITSQFYTIAQSKTANSSVIIGGMQDNGTDVLNAGGLNWKGIIGGDGSYVATTQDDLLWYASFQNGQTLRLTFNEDFGITTFGRVDPGTLVADSGSPLLFINPYILDPNNENRMFYAGGTQLYFNPNVAKIPGGTQIPTSLGWEPVLSDTISTGLVSAIEMSFNSKKLYFGTTGGQLFGLDSAGNQLYFDVDSIPSPLFPKNAYISNIAIDPEDEDHFLVIFSSYNVPSIFESTDGGNSFMNVGGNLEENLDGSGNGASIRWAEIIPTNTGSLFAVGTSTGLYFADELSEETEWVRQAEDVLGASVVPMMDYRPSDGKLAVATHGNGVFITQIADFKALERNSVRSTGFRVLAPYPNPFLEETTIPFEIPEDGEVRVNILSAKGDLITTVLWAPQFAGYNEVTWRGTNAVGTTLANGIYFYTIEYRNEVRAGRILLRR